MQYGNITADLGNFISNASNFLEIMNIAVC